MSGKWIGSVESKKNNNRAAIGLRQSLSGDISESYQSILLIFLDEVGNTLYFLIHIRKKYKFDWEIFKLLIKKSQKTFSLQG